LPLPVLRRCLFSAVILSKERSSESKGPDKPRPTSTLHPFLPQNPQQIRMSSPSTPKNPHNFCPINHFPNKNTWHSSFPSSRIIKSVSKTKQTRPNPPGLRF
jgi:hypothetical protein